MEPDYLHETPFVIRAYGIQELAQLYFPHIAPTSASVQLRKWISHPALYGQLAAAGYHRGQRILTPRQVEIIVRHVGEP